MLITRLSKGDQKNVTKQRRGTRLESLLEFSNRFRLGKRLGVVNKEGDWLVPVFSLVLNFFLFFPRLCLVTKNRPAAR